MEAREPFFYHDRGLSLGRVHLFLALLDETVLGDASVRDKKRWSVTIAIFASASKVRVTNAEDNSLFTAQLCILRRTRVQLSMSVLAVLA